MKLDKFELKKDNLSYLDILKKKYTIFPKKKKKEKRKLNNRY